VGATSATLHGSIDDSCLFYFDYATDAYFIANSGNYDQQTPESTGPPFSQTVAALLPNTTYHYRFVADNCNDRCFVAGADATFTTGAPPALQLTAVQANPGTTSALVTWQTNNAANSRVDYGATTAYGSTVSDPSSVTSHSVTLTGLTPSTTYHFQVTSVDGFSQTSSSADASFTTGAPLDLILNPGFESGSANWTLDPGASIDTTAADAHSGNNSLKLMGLVAWQGSSQYVAVTAGRSYTFSGWERSTSATGNSGYITLTAYDANYVQIGSGTSLVFASTSSWSSKSGTYVPPAGAVRVSIRVQNDGPGTFWFDDLSLTQP